MNPQLPPFANARVLVVGDVMLDRYWQGTASRVSPEAPVPVVQVQRVTDRPGGAANVALNISALGAAARLLGYTGEDEAADSLASLLAAAQVDSTLLRDPARPTTIKLRVISQQQQLLRLDFEQRGAPGAGAPPLPSLDSLLSGCGALVLSDYDKGAIVDPAPLIAAAARAGVPVLVDPKGSGFARYRGATLLTPNEAELRAVVGDWLSEADLVARSRELLRELAIEGLLLTRGDRGMTLLRPDAAELHLPARAREVFDVTGAGDTVIATVAAALAAGASLPDAVDLANVAAGIVVSKAGTATVSAYELVAAGRSGGAAGGGVVSLEQLQLALAGERGQRVVFTNGCFDILHAGHVRYLEAARRLGDRLVVAVNSDESVARLKGAGRPVNPLQRRMAVLAALEAVDWVVGFDEDTPERLLDLLRPEVLVKGGDYRDRSEVVGSDLVEGYGGRVELIALEEDVSTTAIVTAIRDRSKG